jgi:hypothetical protein
MSRDDDQVSYYLTTQDLRRKRWRVRGVRVGRFAVRHAIPGNHPETSTFRSVEETPWRVDHTASGGGVVAFDNPADAFAFADDISRFSKSDPSSSDSFVVVKQIGSTVGRWVEYTRKNGVYTPFREWVETYDVPWTPSRRKRWPGLNALEW